MKFLKTEETSSEQMHDSDDEREVLSFHDEEVILSIEHRMSLHEMKSIIEKECLRDDSLKKIPPFKQIISEEMDETVYYRARTVEIKLLSNENVALLVEWTKACLTTEICKKFGSPIKKMKEKKYWDNLYKKYLCFVIFLDSIVVGICNFQGNTSLDEGYIPSGYMARKKRKKNDQLHKNLADLSWLKACPKDMEPDCKGVMTHAISFIISIIANESTKQIRGWYDEDHY